MTEVAIRFTSMRPEAEPVNQNAFIRALKRAAYSVDVTDLVILVDGEERSRPEERGGWSITPPEEKR